MVIAAKLALAYAKLCFRYLLAPPHDIVLVGYLGHFDVFPARVLSWLRRKPLVFDAFVSLYDTSVEDRKVFRRGSLSANLLRLIDRWSCKLSDLVLLDTNQHIEYFCNEFDLDASKFQRVLVGADPAYAAEEPVAPREDRFVVLHYSKFAPLHRMPYILDAANQLRDDPEIVFKIVGGGQTFAASKAYAERLGLRTPAASRGDDEHPPAMVGSLRIGTHFQTGCFEPAACSMYPSAFSCCTTAGSGAVLSTGVSRTLSKSRSDLSSATSAGVGPDWRTRVCDHLLLLCVQIAI